jgi:hypothetical protein
MDDGKWGTWRGAHSSSNPKSSFCGTHDHSRSTLLQAEAAVIAFCIAKRAFVAFEGEYSDLPQSFEPDFKCKPAKRIGRFDPAVKIPIVDKNVIDDILENVEEYDGDK